ncbi:MFS transporter [Crepidotus variabilis]|uniref:MFS transporter n=1 Tax=Crepidotus variabilis TaxID=179855 RepID=A0A9P6EEE3_9AGAR|nr:MFS transporter [Crepidotus variabilis]
MSNDEKEKIEERQSLDVAPSSASLGPADNPDYSDWKFRLPEPGSLERTLGEKKLVRKLDMRLMPVIILIYFMNYIDRNNVAAARLKGLQEDLKLDDTQYDTVIAILFVSYIPAQIPSNMILNKISRPSLYIGICSILWGLTSLLTGVTRNYAGILACRICIGIPEAAFYPGSIYLLSRWYTKNELAFRAAFLYIGALSSNAFGNLIAAGILSNMEGAKDIRAWRWLFFVEGAITILIGFFAILLLPDYPNNTRWLSQFDLRLAQARLSEDAGEADVDNAEESPLKGLLMAIRDTKVILFAILVASQFLGLSFLQFFPTLTKTLKYNTTITLLLAAPPWILAAIVCCVNALHADKTGERFFHINVWWWSVIVGFIISMSTMSTGARYFSLFLMALGYVGWALTLAWVSNVVPRPPAKRAAAIAIVNGSGHIGTVIGSYSWKASWGPQYHQSMGITLAALVVSSSLAFVVRQILVRENRKLDENEKTALEGADRLRVEQAAKLEGITFDQAMERRKGFRYLY